LLTKEDFIIKCCKDNNISIEELNKIWEVSPCNCEYKKCQGWKVELKPGALQTYYREEINL